MPGRAEIARNRNQSLKARAQELQSVIWKGTSRATGWGLKSPSWVEKRIQIIYLLALISGTRRAPVHPHAQHLELLAAQHLLVGALLSHGVALAAGLAQQTQRQRQAVVQGNEGRGQACRSAQRARLGLVLRNSTRACRPGSRRPPPTGGRAGWSAIRSRAATGRSCQSPTTLRDLLHFAQHAFERVLGHAGMVAQCAKRQALPFQVLQQRA